MNYSVSSCERTKELPAKGDRGALIVYTVTLDQGGSTFPGVELLQKPETPAPEVGQKLEGQIQQTDFGPRFRKAQKPFGEGKGGGRSPADTKAIQRQHSQEMALRAMAVGNQLGVSTTVGPIEAEEFRARIKAWTDWFETDISA